MNTDNNAVTPNLPAFTKSEEEEIMQLAAVGFMPREIAVAMEWPREKRVAFCLLANTPGSEIAMMIAAGKALGRADPQKKLQAAAQAGNIDAIKTLQKLQANNRFNELVNHMDDDEFTD